MRMTPRLFGPYELQSLIGVGGMGEVWRARDTRRDRLVAIKLLPESLANDREFTQRFRRESEVAARLREPHVIPIHDYGEIDGRLFIEMRLVDGRDLAGLLQEGPLPPARAVAFVAQIADALDSAHADGLVHRDIKPSNVIVTANDFVYVVDFGIARSLGSTRTALTITGATVGTLDYMAPERFTHEPIDGRTDVYSLACLLCECLTGQRPFPGTDLPSLLYATCTWSRRGRASSSRACRPSWTRSSPRAWRSGARTASPRRASWRSRRRRRSPRRRPDRFPRPRRRRRAARPPSRHPQLRTPAR